MKFLDRILLARADEQLSTVGAGADPPDVYTARCRWEGCVKLVAYWNKTQMCGPHARRRNG